MPGYTAYFSNSLKSFVKNHSDRIMPSGIFDSSSIIIVQNKNMEEWLKLAFVSENRIYCGAAFMFPDQCIRKIAGYSPELVQELETKKIIYLDELKIIIYRKLEKIIENIDLNPVYKPLQKYVESVSAEKNDDKLSLVSSRLYSLSDTIAGLFYHYGFNCPEMTSKWSRRNSFTANGEYSYLLNHEKWQTDLWNRIFSDNSDYLHLGLIITGIIEGKYSLPQIDLKIKIFGSSFLSEQSIEFFYFLGSKCGVEIDHFILTPSPGKPGIFNSWGSILEGLIDILSEKKVKTAACFDPPDTETSLGYVKSLLYNPSLFLDREKNYSDSTLRITSAPGKRREVEILKNNIIYLVNREGYSLNDIGVAAPDINSYIPYIESVFYSPDPETDIKFNLMDIDYVKQSVFIRGFLDIADLSGSRFSRKELFKIFSNPSFMEKMNIGQQDLEKWLEVCEELTIKWGIDKNHKKEILSGKGETIFATWGSGAERIAAGFVFDSKDEEIRLPGGSVVVPYPLSDYTEEKKISYMITSVEMLFSDIFTLKNRSMKLPEWTAYLEKIMDKYLKPVPGTGQDRDRMFLKNVFRQINKLDSDTAEPGVFRFSVFRTLLEEFASRGGHYKGHYLSGGVSFSSLKPLRAIPFKVIFLLGMDFQQFPGHDRQLSYDLRTVTTRSIDLSREKSDSFAFLETIISAEERLYISYTGLNLVSGELLEPSAAVSELADLFSEASLDAIRIKHPLHGFDSIYFSENSGSNYISYDAAFLSAAEAALQAVSGNCRKQLPPLPDFSINKKNTLAALSLTAGIHEFTWFLKNPLSYFLKKILSFPVNPLELAENDVTEKIGLDWDDRTAVIKAVAESGTIDNYEDFMSRCLAKMINKGMIADSGISKIEQGIFISDNFSFYDNLKGGGFFSSVPVEIQIGSDRKNLFYGAAYNQICEKKEPVSSFYPAVVIEGENGRLELSGVIRSVRRYSTTDYCSVLPWNSSLNNLIPHFVNYLFLDYCHKKENPGTEINYTLFVNNGSKKLEIAEMSSETANILKTAADAYFENLDNPFVTDTQCLETVLKNIRKAGTGENMRELLIKEIKNYYEVNPLKCGKYLRGDLRLAYTYDREIFLKLIRDFYFCLV